MTKRLIQSGQLLRNLDEEATDKRVEAGSKPFIGFTTRPIKLGYTPRSRFTVAPWLILVISFLASDLLGDCCISVTWNIASTQNLRYIQILTKGGDKL